MKNRLNLFGTIAVVTLLVHPIASKNNDAKKENKIAKGSVTVAGFKLTLSKAVDLVLRNNLTIRNAKYDVEMTDTEIKMNNKKYAWQLGVEGGYQDVTAPPAGITKSSGNIESWQYDVTASVSKYFFTGTRITVGVQHLKTDVNDKDMILGPGMVIPQDPAFNKPNFFVTVQQELLKNAFGMNDRLQEKIIKNRYKRNRAAIINQLTGLVVTTLTDYWTVTIKTKAIENAQSELQSAIKVRNIIRRNIRLGLSEKFELNQYNSVVALAQTKLKMAVFQKDEAVRKLLRTVNLPPTTKISGVTELSNTLPKLNKEKAIKTAFLKRVDYINALLLLKANKNNLTVKKNEMLPSLTASFSLSSNSQNESVSNAYKSVTTGDYPVWAVRLKATYPLWDEGNKANLRNAKFKIKQSHIQIADLKQSIRDDVTDRYEEVKLNYELLQKQKIVLYQSQQYYYKLLQRSRQGKFNSVAVKSALDNLVSARQRKLEMLVQFNVAMLRYDLAKNEIFERYNINIEKLLKEVK